MVLQRLTNNGTAGCVVHPDWFLADSNLLKCDRPDRKSLKPQPSQGVSYTFHIYKYLKGRISPWNLWLGDKTGKRNGFISTKSSCTIWVRITLSQRLVWWDRPPSGILHGWHVATSLPLLETMLDELKQESLAFLFTTPPKRVFLSLSNLWTGRQQRAQLSGSESVLIEGVNRLQARIFSSFIHRLASCGLLWGRAHHTFGVMECLSGEHCSTIKCWLLILKKKVLKFTLLNHLHNSSRTTGLKHETSSWVLSGKS